MGNLFSSFFSESEQKKIAEFSRKAKKELSSLPVISAVGDSVQGASGLSELQSNLRAEPDDPKHWLFYYEGYSVYRKLNNGVNVGRGLLNPVGFIIGKGVSTGLNAADDLHKAFDPDKCLGMVITLLMKKVKNPDQKMASEEFVMLSKALAYSAGNTPDSAQKQKMLKRAVTYTSNAIQIETSTRKQAEYFFYLSQFYDQLPDWRMRMRTLNLSRTLGFLPAEQLMKSILMGEASNEEAKKAIEETASNAHYRTFFLTYQPEFDTRVQNTWRHVKEQQQKKFTETGKKLGGFLEKHL